MVIEEKNNKPRCKKCGSKFIYIRIKDNEIVCRSCGHISELNNKLDDEKKEE